MNTFDSTDHEKGLCTNCTKEICVSCLRRVKLASYGEDRERMLCQPCIVDVKNKILKWRAVGRGTGRAVPPGRKRSGSVSSNSDPSSPNSPHDEFLGNGSIGKGRGISRRGSLGRGTFIKPDVIHNGDK